MALLLTPEWGPYTDCNDARTFLTRFVDGTCGPETGVVWAANGNIYPLRAPRRDASSIGTIAIFEWNKPLPPSKPSSGFWDKVKAFIKSVLDAEGQAAILQSQADMAMGQAAAKVLGRMFASHQDDGVGVALDILCIALSVALLPTGLGVLGAVGLFGGLFFSALTAGPTRLNSMKKTSKQRLLRSKLSVIASLQLS